MEYNTIISVEVLKDHLDDENWAVVDCRFNLVEPAKGEEEYRDSHIPRSSYAHLDRDLSSPVLPGITGRHPLPDVKVLANKIRSWGINQDTQVVIYDHANGGIAARLWWLLRWLGHEKVAVLDGGWQAWNRSLMPVTSDILELKEGNFQPVINPDLVLDGDGVESIRKADAWTLVDSRAHERYLGLVEPIDPVAGHIDGAINHPFADNVAENGSWKSSSELKKLFAVSGIGKDPKHTVFYCGSGVTACHNLLAYKYAGLGDALLYPGSWSEWITRK